MTIEELIKAKNIIEDSKEPIFCNSNVAKKLPKTVGRYFKVVINEFVEDNQCLLYDNDKLNL